MKRLFPPVLICVCAGCSGLSPFWAGLGAGLTGGAVAGYQLRALVSPPEPPLQPTRVTISPSAAPEAAPLLDALAGVVRRVHVEGTPPNTPETGFAVEAIEALRPVVGPTAPDAKSVAPIPEAARVEAAKIASAQAARMRETEELKKALEDFESQRRRTTWLALGATALVALAGVVLVWFKFGHGIGISAALVWAALFSALGAGALYRYNRPIVLAAGVVMLVVALLTIVVARLLQRDALYWLGFAQKRVIAIQEVRRLMTPADREKFDALLKRVQGVDRHDEAIIAKLKADLDLAHVTNPVTESLRPTAARVCGPSAS